jgi:pimeloyl-ACP methyl ester carboxylesterase
MPNAQNATSRTSPRPHGRDALSPPGALRLALEMRMPFEFGASLAAMPLLTAVLPRGDGHPVVVFPGLAASDMSTAPLRRFLTRQGYDAHAWEQGRNLGPGRGVLEACFNKVHHIAKSTGRKVSLIGWSLGGIYARETAKVLADDVRSVITLGTPFAGSPRATNAWQIYEMVSGEDSHHRHESLKLDKAPPCPTTSIYSRTDGIVAWQCSIQKPSEHRHTENIEVEASHVGLGVNPAVMFAVADRLAQADGQWMPFDRSGFRSLFFKNPATSDWYPKSCLV